MLEHGIDLHKRTLSIATLDEAGEVVRERRLRCRREAVAGYFRDLPGPHRAVVESTGSWYWLEELCRREGIDLTLAHAWGLKAIAAAKVKTDPVDALTLARLLRADLIPEAHMVSPELRPYRDLLRTRIRLVQRRTACKNSISRLLEKYNVESTGQLTPLVFLQACMHEDQVELLDRQIKELDQQIGGDLRLDDEVQRLLWIPGVGLPTALTIYLETGDASRFPTERQYFSYCRLVPGARNSGEKTKHRPSRAGNPYLKHAFRTAAVRAIQHYPEIKAFYQRKARRKNRFIAQSIVAKDLARAAYIVLKEQVDYNGTFKGEPLSNLKAAEWPRRASPAALLEPSSPSEGETPSV